MDDQNCKKKPKKIHGTLVKVTDDNVDEVAKEIMKMIQKDRKPKRIRSS